MTQHQWKPIPAFVIMAMLTVIFDTLCGLAFAQIISVGDVYQLEGAESGSSERDFLFFIDISGTIHSPITLHWSTRDITTKAGRDYEAVTNGELVLMPGDQFLTEGNRRNIAVKVFNDDSFEEDESFELVVTTDSDSATVSNKDGVATGHILNEDGTRVSIGSFRENNNRISFELNFDPPLRFPLSPDQPNRLTLELPVLIEKNSDIIFKKRSDWNTGGQQVLPLIFYISNKGRDDNAQNFVEASSKDVNIEYDGDHGEINLEIVGNYFFQPDAGSYYIPAIWERAACFTQITCKVNLDYSIAERRKYSYFWGLHASEYAVIIWFILAILAIIGLIFFAVWDWFSTDKYIRELRDDSTATSKKSNDDFISAFKNSEDDFATATKATKDSTTVIFMKSKENTAAIIVMSENKTGAMIIVSEDNTA